MINVIQNKDFSWPIWSIVDDADGDPLTLTWKDETEGARATWLGAELFSASRTLGGRAKYLGVYGWFTIRATDPHGAYTEFDLKINVTESTPEIDYAKYPPDQYVTVG